ncbi:DNA polymerase IV [Salipiger mucosus]|uniref:DNA polymerase IV n=1 Tax=Salipiger mucosus DSM 16094 TaxID=1123237 RepID=S9QVG3_9RHOB|nr:DNA polymerase IV [Salipiger mucosus]EPX83578.1 DNA polymerase IV [Salipiger mucosus DSM 16094]
MTPAPTPTAPQPTTRRRIIHIDMDAFFASVEQRDRPELRGVPVAVGRAKARGVVAAASYEARTFGVKSAMPSTSAARACPDLVFVAPRFDVYRAVSAQIHEIFLRYTDLIEPLSLDEAYLDVTEACDAGATATDIATEIRAAIRAETELTASAGVSFNKFLAKLASDQDKPDGLTVIRPSRALDFVAALPVGRFHGIGPVTEEKMHGLGIETGADLRNRDITFLLEHFGSSAEHYHAISRGIDDRPVQPHRERKSVGAEETFETDLTDLEPAVHELGNIAQKVETRAREKGVVGRTVTVKVKYVDFEQITRQRTLSTSVRDAPDVSRIAASILGEVHPFEKPIRLLGVSLSSLEDDTVSAAQPSFFDLLDAR